MKVLVVYYSLYGHVRRLALAVAEGVESVPGVELVLRRVREFEDIEREVIPKSKHAQEVWEHHKDLPVCTLDDLRAADGLIFGTPTRFGNMTAQMKRLFDSAASLWLEGTLEGKPAGMFVSTATTHGGQETTPFTMMAPLLHLGMIIVGVPYSTPGMLHTEGRGGSPYASSTVAGSRNELTPTPEDLDIARALGKRIADIAKKLRG
ncbi:MAG: NAD(P)H:quinone oxidoreductase [Syntrophobacterales bacterium]|jgi:NAD(P)H dehydrogenase (quinone)